MPPSAHCESAVEIVRREPDLDNPSLRRIVKRSVSPVRNEPGGSFCRFCPQFSAASPVRGRRREIRVDPWPEVGLFRPVRLVNSAGPPLAVSSMRPAVSDAITPCPELLWSVPKPGPQRVGTPPNPGRSSIGMKPIQFFKVAIVSLATVGVVLPQAGVLAAAESRAGPQQRADRPNR